MTIDWEANTPDGKPVTKLKMILLVLFYFGILATFVLMAKAKTRDREEKSTSIV